MARDVLDAAQLVNGTEVEIHFVIDNITHHAKEVVSFDFEEDLVTEKRDIMGDVEPIERVLGLTTSGTMTVNTGNPMINQFFEQYKRDRTIQNISVKTIQEDPSSSRGRRVVYYDNFKFKQNKLSGGTATNEIRTETVTVSFKAGRTTEDFKKDAQ